MGDHVDGLWVEDFGGRSHLLLETPSLRNSPMHVHWSLSMSCTSVTWAQLGPKAALWCTWLAIPRYNTSGETPGIVCVIKAAEASITKGENKYVDPHPR